MFSNSLTFDDIRTCNAAMCLESIDSIQDKARQGQRQEHARPTYKLVNRVAETIGHFIS